MIWHFWLNPEQARDLELKGALKLGDQFKKFSAGKSGQWQKMLHTKYDLLNDQNFQLSLVGEKESSDSDGFYYLQSNSGKAFTINGRISYGCYLFNGDQVVFDSDLFSFKKETPDFRSQVLEPQVIQSDNLVLLVGETGTGKGYLAKKIYEQRVSLKKWVHLNLSSLTPSLIESEIFGHSKGAFTGAICDYPGALKSADQSVLFLDEIDSLSLELQSKLLLFLDDYKFKAVGSQKEQRVKLKLIVASGRKLEDLVEKGLMRADFYYRLTSGFKIFLQPLRQDKGLIKSYCDNFATLHRLIIEPSLLEFYLNQKWPGNFRQLKSHLETKLTVNANKYFIFDELDQQLITPFNAIYKNDLDSYHSMDLCKRSYATYIYQKCMGDINRAAKILEITTKTLRMLLSEQLNWQKCS